ncbi:MAG: ssl1498 family light-harvesting-like protein [Oscillatoriales cyanobacterium]|nr:MAG: ssl1498 family light-harvesting-like protein [Oscillatoriales cyanobacterium]
MYTTTNETGQLNNYAKEPKMYYSHYPTLWEHAQLGGVAVLFLGVMLAVSFAASAVA